MKKILILCLTLLIGCVTVPSSANGEMSVDDYCTGVGNFVYAISEQIGDYNRNNPTPVSREAAKGSVTTEIQQTAKDLPKHELKKMMDMVDFIFDNLALPPDQAARNAYATCVTQLNNNTWFDTN